MNKKELYKEISKNRKYVYLYLLSIIILLISFRSSKVLKSEHFIIVLVLGSTIISGYIKYKKENHYTNAKKQGIKYYKQNIIGFIIQDDNSLYLSIYFVLILDSLYIITSIGYYGVEKIISLSRLLTCLILTLIYLFILVEFINQNGMYLNDNLNCIYYNNGLKFEKDIFVIGSEEDVLPCLDDISKDGSFLGDNLIIKDKNGELHYYVYVRNVEDLFSNIKRKIVSTSLIED
jgi:hypothetical protein